MAMSDKQMTAMMEQCDMHMSRMSPEMRQKHMEMMKRRHQMMEQSTPPTHPG